MAPKGKSLGEALFCGGGAGAVEATMMFPAESVKTQLQLQDRANPKYKSAMDVVRGTVQHEGVRGLYRGVSVLISGSVPKAAVRFMTYEAVKSRIDLGNEYGTIMAAGLCAGLAEALVVVTPAEVLKTRLIHDLHTPKDQRLYRGLIHGTTTIARAEGIAGLYRGLSATLIKQGSNQMVRFVVKEKAEQQLNSMDSTNFLYRPVKVACAGAVGGAASVFANNPIDVIKSKMQGIGAREAGTSTMASAARAVYRAGGLGGFYAGVMPRLVRVMGDAAISFTIYDELTRIYEKFRH